MIILRFSDMIQNQHLILYHMIIQEQIVYNQILAIIINNKV